MQQDQGTLEVVEGHALHEACLIQLLSLQTLQGSSSCCIHQSGPSALHPRLSQRSLSQPSSHLGPECPGKSEAWLGTGLGHRQRLAQRPEP